MPKDKKKHSEYVYLSSFVPNNIKQEVKKISLETGIKMYVILKDVGKYREEIATAVKSAKEKAIKTMYDKIIEEIKNKYQKN